MRKITEDQFESEFHMKPNHFFTNPEDCPFSGCMYETYGQELDHIVSLLDNIETAKTVWTIVEDDTDDLIFYVSGFHIINRLGYFVTEERVEEETSVEIDVSVDEF